MLTARTVRATVVPGIASSAIPTPILAVLALVVAAAFWGTAFAAAKVVLVEMPPAAVAVLRSAIAAVVLVPIAFRAGGRPALGLQPALLGLTSVVIFLTQNVGLTQTSAAHATVILGGGMPALIAVFGACWLGERPTRRQLAGLACSLLGVAVVAAASAQAASSLRGDGMLALTAAAGAVYAVLGRRAFAGRNAVGVLAGSACWATVLLVPPAAAELVGTDPAWPAADAVVLLLYLGLCCSALAFALWAFALRHLTAAQNAVGGALELPIGLAAAALLAGEALGPAQVLAGALVVAGVVLAVRARPPQPSGAEGAARRPARPPVAPLLAVRAHQPRGRGRDAPPPVARVGRRDPCGTRFPNRAPRSP